MSSASIAHYPDSESYIQQGDIFCDVKYTSIDDEDKENEQLELSEYTFPYALVLSQSCDVWYMNEIETRKITDPLKFMPGIIMCPIYDSESAHEATHLGEVYNERGILLNPARLYISEDKKFAKRDQHVRFHALSVNDNKGKVIIEDAVIDF